MHRIDHTTRKVDANGAGKDGFTIGDPTRLIPATRVMPDWLNAIQEEIANAITDAGAALVKANNGQLTAAITTRINTASAAINATISALPGTLSGSAAFLNAAYAWTAQHTHAALSKFAAGLVASLLRLDGGDLLYSDATGAPVYRGRLYQLPLNVLPGMNPTIANWYMAPGGNLVSIGAAEGHIPIHLPRGSRLTGLNVGVIDGGSGARVSILCRKTSFNYFDGTITNTAIEAVDKVLLSDASNLYRTLTIGTLTPPEAAANGTHRYRLTITAEGSSAQVLGAVIGVEEAGFMGNVG